MEGRKERDVSLACRDDFVRALHTLSERAREGQPNTSPWWSALKDAEVELAPLVREESVLEEFWSEKMRGSGSGVSRLSTTSLVNWLMERTLAVGADETISDLERYLTSATFPARFSIGIRGVTVQTPVYLAEGVELLPHSGDVVSFELRDRPAASTAALTIVSRFPKVTLTSEEGHATTSTLSEGASAKAFERLQIARMCIAIVVNSRVVETVHVSNTAPSVPSSGSRSGWTVAQPPNVPIRALAAHDSAAVIELHRHVTQLPGKLKDRLIVALHRWHSLFLDSGVGADFFIDLGIGLESVFVSEKAPEIGYRLAVRGARLLGGPTVASRTHMAKVLGTLYDARSQAVHSGRLLAKIPAEVAPSIGHLAMDGEELLRKASITMIYRGRDDWDELVFA